MVCKDCFIRPAFSDTELCPTCEVRHEVYAAQASCKKVFFATFGVMTIADVKQFRLDGWTLVKGDLVNSEWYIDLSFLSEKKNSAA